MRIGYPCLARKFYTGREITNGLTIEIGLSLPSFLLLLKL